MQNVDIEMFGDFDLDRDRFSTIKINDFETNTDVSTKSRFGVISDLEIEKFKFQVKKITVNTKKNIWWALIVFKNWHQENNRSVSLEIAVPDCLRMDVSTMIYSFTRFGCDARKKEGIE